jgi:hypothetical protein
MAEFDGGKGYVYKNVWKEREKTYFKFGQMWCHTDKRLYDSQYSVMNRIIWIV